MDFPYLISSLKYQLDNFKASEAGNKRGTCPIRGLCALLLPIPFVVSPPHRPTQHLSAGSSLQGHHPNQSYQVHQDLDTVLHTAVQAGDQTLSPPVPPRRSSATTAQLRSSCAGKQKVTGGLQQISCWFCAKTLLLLPR